MAFSKNKSDYMTEIGDDYVTMGKCLGIGSFGSVDLVRDKRTKKTYAIKRISKNHIIENGMGNQVRKEIYILKNLHHPNIVHIREVLSSPDSLYIVMEYVSGGELYNLIALYGTIPESKCIKYTRQICDALAFCHKLNICHRDIKPQNILIDADDNIRLIDFGFASIMEVDNISTSVIRKNKRDHIQRMTFDSINKEDEFERSMESKSVVMKKMGTICGTHAYMAPEILSNSTYMADKTDIWAFGTVVFFLLTGRMPFSPVDEKKDTYTFPKNINKQAQDFINNMLNVDPHKRYSAQKLLSHNWIRDDSEICDDFVRKSIQLSSADNISRDILISDTFSEEEDGSDIIVDLPDVIDDIPDFMSNLTTILENDKYKWSTRLSNGMMNISTTFEIGIILVKITIDGLRIHIQNSDPDIGIPLSMMNHIHNVVLTTLSVI